MEKVYIFKGFYSIRKYYKHMRGIKMGKNKQSGDQDEESWEFDSDDITLPTAREAMVENDEIGSWEAGFMEGEERAN